MTRKLLGLIWLPLVVGCAAFDHYENDFDPNQEIVFGVVKVKNVVVDPDKYMDAQRSVAAQRMELVQQQALAIGAGPIETVGGIIIVSILGLEPPGGLTVQGDPIAYTVDADTGDQYLVMSFFPGFNVGQCVKLFLSEDPERYPPRMTEGWECRQG